MVAVVTGNGLGLFNTSLNMLGGGGVLGQGGFGQAGGQALVNASNGNLVLQFTDRQLSGLGLDLLHTRTYNTQGTYGDADGDGWRWDGERRVALNGELNAAGSSVVRTTGDGHETLYRWNGSVYQSTDGDGAHDSLSWDGARSEWVWTDGSRRTQERYAGASGRLVQVSDAFGTRIDYGYDDAGRLNSVKDVSGQELVLVYNAAGRLERLDTRQMTGGALTQQVYYSYDELGRLASVTTDLTPNDNSISDGKVYTTAYTYDGSSFRIASVSQSDGTSVNFTYELVGGEYRVKTVTDASGTTTFAYDLANRRTDITNGLNQQWSYFYDEAGRLVEVRTPPVDGQRLSTRYAYDADGNVLQVTDGRGNAITYGYDANGNRVLERDAQGNTLRRVYGANNELLNEIRYNQPAIWNGSGWTEPPAASAQVVRHAYDGSGRLRYVVSAGGVVSEYRYNAQGQRIRELSYGDANYDLGALAQDATLNTAQLDTWTAARDLTRSTLLELSYDYRGNLRQSTRYAMVTESGTGYMDLAATVTVYIYSERGELLQTIAARSSDTALNSFGYDGLGRLLSQTDASGTRTYTYNGANRTVVMTNSAGLTQAQAYDAHGRLLSLTESAAGLVAPRLTQYRYDAAGRQVMVQDATGVRSYTFYDEAGRVSAKVDGLGAVTEYRYNEAGQKSSEIRYANLVDTSTWYDGNAVTKTLVSQIRPTGGMDRSTTYAYDAAGRLSSSTDSLGYATTYRYDGRGQLVQTLDNERSTRIFYDADGRVVAKLDGEGYLVENRYDALGRLKQVTRYALATAANLRAEGTLEQLRPAATGALNSWYYYDAIGRQIGSIDEQGFVSETVYDEVYNRQQNIRYAQLYSAAVISNDFANVRAAVESGARQISTTVYDSYGRVSQRIGTDGTVTAYEYDNAGRLIREIRAQGTAEARTSAWRYDALGQLLGKLTGEGASRLTAGQSEAQVRATYAQYGLTYSYDVAGRQLSVTDSAGNTLLSYYDAAGRLTHTVNKLGEITENTYNTFGEVITNTRFYERLSSTANLTGGLLTTPLSALTQTIRSNVANSTTRFDYDRGGRLISSINALGYGTTYGYNRYGQQTSITRDITGDDFRPESVITYFSYNKRGELIRQLEDVAGLDRSTTTQYDAFGRVIARTDGRGLTSTLRYDNGGRVVVSRDPLNQSQTIEYDAFGRMLAQTDALGRVTNYVYDDVNRTLTQTLPGGVQVVSIRNRHDELLSIRDGNGNTTTYSYNKNGQLLSSTNALGQTTHNAYDAKSGFKTSTMDAGGNITRYSYDVTGRTLTVTDALNVITRYDYDGMGRKMRVTEAAGTATQRVTEYGYDCVDQVTRITQDPNGLGLTTTYSYDGLGRQLEVSRGTVAAPRQQVTRYEFDHLGRRVAEYVDPDGLNLTTRYVYNANDQIEQKIQVLNTSTSYKTLYAYDSAGRLTSTTDALGYKESYTYDAVGNRKTLTNKKGDVWTYNYDSLNRLTEEISPKISVGSIDAAGNVSSGAYHVVTRIAYDNAGNVLSRTEGVLRSTVNGADNNQQARTTRYTYDKLNRQIGIISPGWYNKSTGAYQQASDGTANTLQITTEVTYDIAGNAVRNRVRVNNTGNSATDFVDSYKVYDKLGRVTHEIDALGGVTAYTYDELGNQLTFKRFANGLTGAVPARGYYLADDIVTKVNAASTGNLLLDATKDRTLTNAYDKAGRKVSVQQDLSNIFTFTGNVSTSTLRTLAPTTLYTYDALGRVVKETLVGRDGSGAIQTTGPSTTYYYDATGNRTGVVDALGHYTRMEYDRLGRLERQMEYSTALPSWNHGAAPAAPASTENDRSTRYSHDALGRVIQVTRENARYWVQNATDLSGRVTDQEMRGDLIESRTSYDAVGNIRTVTDALNNVTTTEYNALGQVTRLIEPQRWAAKAGVVDPFALGFGGIVLASPTTTYEMNAFGQVIREIRAAGVDASSNAQSGVTQHSRTLYDSAGNEVKSIDASNAVETYKVDAAGRRIEELQQVSMTLNAWTWLDGNKFQYTQDIRRNFEYDKLGRQTATIAWYGDWDGQTKAARESAEYNHFGEITAKRMNGGLIGLYNYNQLGRVESYVDQQKWIVAVDYDLAGNATRSNQIGQLWGSPDDDRITYTLYDKLGRAIEQHLPGFSANTSADTLNNVGLAKVTPVIKQVFDRWGNVTLRTDARGQNTFYNYDHNNRLWAETHTATDILRENGTIYRANTMQQYHYDAVGKHIATQDWVWPYSGQANFTLLRTRHYVHNQVGEMEREVDALGNWRTYRMDAHGNRIATRDAAGVVTVSTYDSMNRLTTHSIMRNGARVVLQTNRYDQAGRLVAEIAGSAEVEETLQSIANTSNWSSNTTGAIGNTRYTLHDARGNILWTRNESGVAMRYGYDAYSRKVTEWDGLRNTRTWSYSPGDWSRMSSHKDLGGRIFNYTYNFFGELERETYVGPDTDGFVGPNPGGIRLERKYAYYENGLLQSIIDTETEGPESSSYSTNKDISAYEYNISGSKTRDTTWKLQNITVEINGTSSTHLWSQAISEVRYLYDEVGRIKGLKMPTGQNLVGSEDHDSWAMYATMNTGRLDALIYDYDELGNRRRVQLDTTDQSNKRTTIDNWYKYDQEGRVLVAEGFLSNGQVVAGKGKGYAMAYNATGQRIFQVKWDKTIDSGTWERYQKDTYTYNDLGLLLNRTMHYENLNVGANYSGAVVSSQSQGLVYSNTYDDLGRRLSQTEYKNGAAYSTVTYSYRGDNQLISQLTYKMDGSRQYLSQATHFAEAGMRDGAGNQTAYRYVIYKSNGGIDYRGNYTTNYAAFDSYKESKTMATWTKSGSPGTTTYRYTDRGELLQVEVTGAKSYTKMFASNREGQFIASKRSDSHNGQSYIYVQGREVANIGNASAPEITDTIEQITKDTFGLTPTNYVVSQGDTLQSIALQVWGDDSMWYLIADANGIVAGDELTPGDSLKIPNVLGATHNDANDFKPYNPRDVIGDTTPQPKLPKPKKKKSGGLGSIVMVVVAVVAAVFTAGAAAAAFAAIGSTAGVGVGTAALTGGLGALGIGAGAAGLGLSIGATAAIGGIVGGAIGSAAGQLTGMAMGIVDNFSWSQVAAGALSGGAASGLSVAAQGMLGGGWIQSAAKAVTANSYQGYATYGVFNYASHQLINKVVGFDTSFSWRGMAASIMGSTIGGAVGSSDYLKGMPRFARNIVSGQISAHSSAALNDKWLGGAQPQHGQIAVDAFGNILAASILSTMESQIKPDLLKDKSLLLASNNSTITLPPTYVYANESEQDTSIAKNNGSSPHLRRIAGENAFDEFLLGFTDGFTELRGLSRENIYNSNSALEAGIASGVYAVNSLTSVVVGGLVDVGRIFTSSEQRSQLGSALHTLVTTNPATTAENAWSAWHALSTEDRLLTAGSVLTGAGVSKIGKIGDVLPNSAPALSRGAELRIKYGHLSAEQRYSIISERTEEIALRQLHTKQAATPGAHFLARHSAETTLREQLVSAATGLRPDGKIMGGANKPFTVDSTKFLSNKDMLYGINRAERIQQHAISTGNPVDDYISLRFSDFVGEGFVKNTPMYGADLSRFYRQTYYANFLINPSTGTAVTAFPVLSLNSLGVLY